MTTGIANPISTGAASAPTVPRTTAGFRRVPLPLPVWIFLLGVTMPIWFQIGPLAMNTLRLQLIVMIVPLTIGLFTGRYGRVLPTDVLFFLHLLWLVIAIAVNNPDRVVQFSGSNGIEFIGGYVLARAYVRTPETFVALCRALILILVVLFPFAIFEAMTGKRMLLDLLWQIPGATSNYRMPPEERMGLVRVQSVFSHPIHYGLFSAVTFSMAFVGLKGASKYGWRYVTGIIAATAGFLALSSGALLAIFLQFGLIIWNRVLASVRLRWWLLLGLFALAYIAIEIASSRSTLRVFMTYATFSAQTAYWRMLIFEWGMQNVWSSPIFGIGLNDWFRPYWMYTSSVDNFWLLMAMRYGIPGFVLIMAGYVWAMVQIIRRKFTPGTALNQLRLAWVFTFMGLSFTLFTVHIWTLIYSFVFFMLGAGMWMTAVDQEDDPQSAKDAAPESRADIKELRFARPTGSKTGDVPVRSGTSPDTGPDTGPDIGPGIKPGLRPGAASGGLRFSRDLAPAASRLARARNDDAKGPNQDEPGQTPPKTTRHSRF